MIGATSADIGGRTGYMVTGARNTATTIAAAGVPVYAYRFSYVAESSHDGRGGACDRHPLLLRHDRRPLPGQDDAA